MWIYIICLLLSLVLYKYSKYTIRRSSPNPPVVEGSNPLKCAYLLRKDPVKLFADARAKFGPTFTINAAGRPITILTDFDHGSEFWKVNEKIFNFHRNIIETKLTLALRWPNDPEHYPNDHIALIQVIVKRFLSQWETCIPDISVEINNYLGKNVKSGQVIELLNDSFCTDIVAISSSRVFFGPEEYANPDLLYVFSNFYKVRCFHLISRV